MELAEYSKVRPFSHGETLRYNKQEVVFIGYSEINPMYGLIQSSKLGGHSGGDRDKYTDENHNEVTFDKVPQDKLYVPFNRLKSIRTNVVEKYNKNDFKDGDTVTCFIEDEYVEDGMISVSDEGDVYICQNIKDGCVAPDCKEYEFSWRIYRPGYGSFTEQIESDDVSVRDLTHKTKTNTFVETSIDDVSKSLIEKGVARI